MLWATLFLMGHVVGDVDRIAAAASLAEAIASQLAASLAAEAAATAACLCAFHAKE